MAEGATRFFSHSHIDMTLEEAKDTWAMLFLSHLEYEPVLLHDKKHLVYSYIIAETLPYSHLSPPIPGQLPHIKMKRWKVGFELSMVRV